LLFLFAIDGFLPLIISCMINSLFLRLAFALAEGCLSFNKTASAFVSVDRLPHQHIKN